MSDDNDDNDETAFGTPPGGIDNRPVKRILSLNDHKPKQQKNGHYATKDDVVAAMSAGFLAMGQKVYTQCMEETTRLLSEMDMRHAEEIAKIRAEVGL